MNILLTNDDGVEAYGLSVMKKLLSKYGDVTIVAPKKVMSAKSVSIIIGKAVEVEKVKPNVFAMDGTPADCVAFGLSSLDKKFDLVVSGCNHGLNVSYDTMYSGTIGACLQALTYRVPAIAVSCEHNFEIVEKHLDEVMNYIENMKMLSTEYLLNINFPVGKEAKEIKETHIFYRPETTFYVKDEEGKYKALREIHDDECLDLKSDVYAVYHDAISITKIKKTLDY